MLRLRYLSLRATLAGLITLSWRAAMSAFLIAILCGVMIGTSLLSGIFGMAASNQLLRAFVPVPIKSTTMHECSRERDGGPGRIHERVEDAHA